MFGVLDSPEYSGSSPGVYRPVISDDKDGQDNLPCVDRSTESFHNFVQVPVSSPPAAPIEVNWIGFDIKVFLPVGLILKKVFFFSSLPYFCLQIPVRSVDLEGPKWVSHWASLADTGVDSGSTLHQEGCLEGGLSLTLTCDDSPT